MSASQDEATLNADGSATFEDTAMPPIPSPNDDPTAGAGSPFEGGTAEEEMLKQAILPQGIDPVVYLLLGVGLALALYYFLVYRNSKKEDEEEMDAFFSQLDGEKVRLPFCSTHSPSYGEHKCIAGMELSKKTSILVDSQPHLDCRFSRSVGGMPRSFQNYAQFELCLYLNGCNERNKQN